MKILDLTDGHGAVSVVLSNKRKIEQPDDNSEALELQREATKSPWRADRLNARFANKSLKSRKLKDPAKELTLFANTITSK